MSHHVKLKKSIAERLKQARESANYFSVEDFCQKNNLSLNSYLLHEQGKATMTASKAGNYSKLLGVSLRWLMLG